MSVLKYGFPSEKFAYVDTPFRPDGTMGWLLEPTLDTPSLPTIGSLFYCRNIRLLRGGSRQWDLTCLEYKRWHLLSRFLSAVSCDFILFHSASNMAVIRKFNP